MRTALFTLLLFFCAGERSTAFEPLKVGDRAPDFTLTLATRDTILADGFRLSTAIGNAPIVLAFYPADWSGGCTREMCTMRDNVEELGALGVRVVGISGDYPYAHRAWARELGLPFGLLSDHRHEVARQYASYNEATGYNLRTVYVVDRGGSIAYIDLEYKAGTEESFHRLQKALASLH
jgi:peroxiredoxin